MQGLNRDISDAEVDEYRETGVVRLRGVLSQMWVDLLADALD